MATFAKSADYTKKTLENSRYFSKKEKNLLNAAIDAAEEALNQEVPDTGKMIRIRKHIAKQIWSRRLIGKKRVEETLPYVGERGSGLSLAARNPISDSRLLAANLRFASMMASPTNISGIITSQKISDARSQARYYRQQEQFRRVMSGDFRQSLSTGDDSQYALGVDTGVHDDFDYLRKRERRERVARINEYLRVKRAKRAGADFIKKHDADRSYAWWYDNLNAYDKEEFDLTRHYGGGAEGRRMARDKMAQRADARHREAASRASISTRQMRLRGMRDFPMWKSFFRDSKNEAKDIRHMSRTLTRMSKVPLIGRFMHMGPAGIGVTLGLGAAALLNKFIDKENASSAEVTKWENAELFYGKPTKRFEEAAKSALITDPAKQAALWGKFAHAGLDPIVGMQLVGSVAKGGSPLMQRIAATMLSDAGISLTGDEVVAARFLSGELTESKSRNLAKKLEDLEVQETKAFSKEGSTVRGIELAIPFSKDIEARTGKNLFRLLLEGMSDPGWSTPFEAAEDAAESLRKEQASPQSSSGQKISQPAGNQVSFNIGTVDVNANNFQEFIKSVVQEGNSRYNAIDVMNWADKRMVV